MPPPADASSDVDEQIRAISAAYPSRVARSSLDAVERLRAATGGATPARTVVVVGTNGKTSTSIFLGRLLRQAAVREGVTTSPHITSWGERITIGGVAVAEDAVLGRLERLHEAAQEVAGRETLRFFDLLTLAAAELFTEAGVEVGVFEAGIGGRLDATRTLAAPFVLLTGVGVDHADLLGAAEADILREKLAVAGRGTRVLASALPALLEREAEAYAAGQGLELEFVRSVDADFLYRNAELACAAAAALGCEVSPQAAAELAAEPIRGRMHRVVAHGVEVVLDAAHNPQAWSEVAGLFPPSFVAVVSVSQDRSPAPLRAALAHAGWIVTTEAWPGRSLAAAALANALRGDASVEAIDEPAAAMARAIETAREHGVPVVVLGSSYLLPHAYAALDL